MTSRVVKAMLLISALAGAGCVTTTGSVASLAPGQRPAVESDEAGLWMLSEKVEERIRTSGRMIAEPELNAYVHDILCRLAPEHCTQVRLYIVRLPHFNASMLANGVMTVWSGLLLRAENEAQLAYILGHELGHYLRRHSIQQWRDLHIKADASAFLHVALAAAGVPYYAGQIADLVAVGSIRAFSRDHEREADDIGFDLMVEASYDPRAAAQIWEAMIEEREATDDADPFIFFATHPDTEERAHTLRARAAALADNDSRVVERESYVAAIRPFRVDWLRDELRRREFAATEVVLARLLAAGEDPAEIHFFRGELYRIRNEEGDDQLAITAYRSALALNNAPKEAHRSLGLVLWHCGKVEQAKASMQAYLDAAPNASDREMVKSYINELGE